MEGGRWPRSSDRKSTRLNSSHTEIYTLSLHDALPIFGNYIKICRPSAYFGVHFAPMHFSAINGGWTMAQVIRSEEHTSELQSHRDLHSFPTRRSSDLW